MRSRPQATIGIVLVAILTGLSNACSSFKTYTYPKPVDTASKTVRLLTQEVFTSPSGTVVRADFAAARAGGFRESGDTLHIDIPAENEPINQSPWYAFSITSPRERKVVVDLTFPVGTGNRYLPKTATSAAGPWKYVPFDRVDTADNHAFIKLDIGPQHLFLAGQELVAADSIRRWVESVVAPYDLSLQAIGASTLAHPIWAVDTKQKTRDRRPAFVFMSRQHPPEVTGFQAYQAFIERLFAEDQLARRFRESYRILLLPVVNPDGVNEGHWRHNAGGIDLNRDWAEYRQPETRAVVTWLQAQTHKRQVVWGMDFHSTQYDVLYTHDPARVVFRNADKLQAWTDQLGDWAARSYPGASAKTPFTPLGRPLVIGQDTLRIEPDEIGRPTSASWMAQHYQAVGVTYEVGDEQDRAYIRAKASKAAELLMQIWLD